jgi:hypothetical protein
MYDGSLGPEWKPDIARFVMNIQGGNVLAVTVDPGHRTAWMREPYYAKFKQMSLELFAKGLMVVVSDGINKILITPDSDVILGKKDDEVTYSLGKEGAGPLVRWVTTIEGVKIAG